MKKLATITLVIAMMGTIANAATVDDGGVLQAQIDLSTGNVTLFNTTAGIINWNLVEMRSTPAPTPATPGVLNTVLDGSGWMPILAYPVDPPSLIDPAWVPVFGSTNLTSFAVMAVTSQKLAESGGQGGYASLKALASWSLGNPILPGSVIDATPAGDFEIVYGTTASPNLFRITDYDFGGEAGDSQGNPIMPDPENGTPWPFPPLS